MQTLTDSTNHATKAPPSTISQGQRRLARAALAVPRMMGLIPLASATPTNVSVDFRQVLIHDNPTGEHRRPNSPSTALGLLSDSVSANLSRVTTKATQATNVNGPGGLFAVSGDANVGFSAADGSGVFAQTFYDVFFDLLTLHSYSL